MTTPTRPGHIEKAPVMDARAVAATIRAGAERDAAAILASAEEARNEARRAGHAEGLAAGREEAVTAMTRLLAEARLDAETVRQDARAAALTLARRMTEKIIGRAVELDASVFDGIVAQAIAESRTRSGAVKVRVHPEDLALGAARIQRIAALCQSGLAITFVADASVDRNGCVVETRLGRVDARLAAQLDAFEAAIRARSNPKVEIR